MLDRPRRLLYAKILWHVLPFVCFLQVLAFADRAAIAYAAPNGMNEELNLTATAFGLVSGIFFVGYILFEVPSNYLLQKFGTRMWLARIIITWGLVQSLTAFVPDGFWLNVLRVLLGLAEAGFVPGVMVYLSGWLPGPRRATAFSIFVMMTVVASVVGGPAVVALINLGHSLGGFLSGWRFMFLITGILPIIAGLLLFRMMPESPATARWLNPREKEMVAQDLAKDLPVKGGHTFRDGLRSPRAWLLGLAYISMPFSGYVVTFFLPTILTELSKSSNAGLDSSQIALLSSIPAIATAVTMIVVTWTTARFGRLGLHVLIITLTGATGAAVAFAVHQPVLALVALCLVQIGSLASNGLVYSILPKVLQASAFAAGVALVNSVGNIGGFSGPFVMGSIKDATGNTDLGFLLISALFTITGIIIFFVDRSASRVQRPAEPVAVEVATTAGLPKP
ncbi:MFS transporter [Arthrobacter sp. YN]|uniref:MFS transporter n=1 Tax=Arthrobacter sp. YN TaxID=2020486 RepID=UPI000B5F4532|nr:MFS transporter [Arthrobacter sp. YN]ASN20159.1 MFS transporter [Arthrobacter sp. YN]